VKVLITGAAGQVGRALLAAAPEGVEVQAAGHDAIDITSASAVRDALRDAAPALVFNAAAHTAVDRAESEPERAHAINAQGVANLARACAEAGARLIHFSTDFVFDGTRSTPYTPDTAPAPLGVYGESKLAGEQAALGEPGNLVIRTAWVHAAGGANFVATMLRLMAEREEVRVVCDQVGTPTHAASLASAAWKLALGGASGIRHFTDAGVASWYDFAVAIREEALALGLLARAGAVVPIPTQDYPTPARRPAYSVLDCTATWAELGAAPRHWRCELRDMLHSMLRTIKDRNSG